MLNLQPFKGKILVEIKGDYKHIAVVEQKYSTNTSGIVIKVDKTDELDYLVGSKVFWEEYKDGPTIEVNDTKYAFVKIEDILGYEQIN